MQDYSRPMKNFVVLQFGILIAKWLFNGNSISSTLACMPVANKIGKKGQKVQCNIFFRSIQKMINKSGNKSLFLNFFWMIIYFNAF